MIAWNPESEPLRVLFFDHVGILSGGERSLVDLVGHFDQRRIQPALACPEEGPLARAFRRMGYPVHHVPVDGILGQTPRHATWRGLVSVRRWLALGVSARALASLLAQGRFHALHTNSLKAHAVGLAAARAAGVPVVWHLRDILPPTILGRALACLGRAGADRILAISGAVAHAYLDCAGVSGRARGQVLGAGHVVVTPNALPVPRAIPRATARFRLGLPMGRPLIGWVGQLAHWKGPQHFLDAASIVARRRPDVRFVMAGSVLFRHNEAGLEVQLERLAHDGGLDGRLIRLGARDDVPLLMAALDTLVHTSIAPEPSGRVIQEAMAAGTPVVASGAGGVGELVADGETGLLARPGDLGDCVAGIAALLADEARARRMGEAGRRRLLIEREPHTLAGCVAGIFEDVVRSRLASGRGGGRARAA